MKHLLLCIGLGFLFGNAESQEVNYIPYYRLINKATIARYQHNCDSALIYYQEAFEMVDYILFDDLYNFTQCAVAANKDSLVYFAMEQCKKQTIFVGSILPEDSSCKKYKQTNLWNTCIAYEQQNYDRYIEKFITTPASIKKILDSLEISDQIVRNNWTWYCRTFPNSKLAKKRHREWAITDSCNQRVVDEMIKKYGFPNERTGLPNDYTFIRGGSGIVLVHYDDSNFFRNVEYKALIDGKLSPDCYASRAMRMASFFKDKWRYTYYYSKRKGKRMTPQEKAQVDKNRYEIGMLSVADEEMIKQINRQEIKKSKKAAKQKK